jgi:hypothetical protein
MSPANKWPQHYVDYLQMLLDREKHTATEAAKLMSRHFKRSFSAPALRKKANRIGGTFANKKATFNRHWRTTKQYQWQVEVNKVLQSKWA